MRLAIRRFAALLLGMSAGGCALFVEDDFVEDRSITASDAGSEGAPTCGGSPAGCDAKCPGTCVGATCFIGCNGKESCRGRALTCPRGMNCELECSGEKACEDVKLTCLDSTCGVSCFGKGACAKLQQRCTLAPPKDCGEGCSCAC